MSTRYNTGNQIESTDMRDMSDNAKNFDEFSNSMSDSFTDRFGVDRQTMEGAVRKAGFRPASFDFLTGGSLVSGDRNKAVFNPAPPGDNNWYAWQGAFPKIVAPNSTPATSGGLGDNAWKPVTNNIIAPTVRESIRRSYAEAGYLLIGDFSDTGLVVTAVTDVVLWEPAGIAYVYSGTLPHTISVGETPIGNPQWVSKSGNTLREEVAAPVGSGIVGFQPAGVGAVPSSVQAKMRESVSIMDFMSDAQRTDAISGAHTLDCTAAAQAAINHCIANNRDLNIPYLVKISQVNIDRIVDGPLNEFYFTIYSDNCGGFYTESDGSLSMFTTSLAFTSTPVSHLVKFHKLRFESANRTNLVYVLDAKKFLRITFSECGFHNIRLARVVAPSYYQSYILLNCFAQGWSGAFMYGDESYDVHVIGGLYQAAGGDYFWDMAKVLNGKVWTTIVNCVACALKMNGPKGVDISGYFETNALDIDFRTGGIPAAGVNIHGCISLVASAGEPYKIKWGEAFGCVSQGNVFYGNAHSLQANSKVAINDHSYESLSNVGNVVSTDGYREGTLTGLTLRGVATANYTTTVLNAKYTKSGNQVTVYFVATLTSTGTNAADALYITGGLPMTNAMVSALVGQCEVVGSTVNNGISPLYISSSAPIRAISSINVIPANTVGNTFTVRGYLTYVGT